MVLCLLSLIRSHVREVDAIVFAELDPNYSLSKSHGVPLQSDYYCFLVKSKSLTCFLVVGAGPRV